MIYQEQKAFLHDFKQTLDKKEEIILFELFYLRGYSTTKKLANHLNIPVKDVRKRIRGVKSKLKQYIMDNYNNYEQKEDE